jgi:hypothetical protein
MVTDPPLTPVPRDKRAISDSIAFSLTLTATISEAELRTALEGGGSIVEFGSDARYLTPEPTSLLLLCLGGLLMRRRR